MEREKGKGGRIERTSLGHESNSEKEKDPESLIGLIINFLSFDESSDQKVSFLSLSFSKNASLTFSSLTE